MDPIDQANTVKRKGDEAFVQSKHEEAIQHYDAALDLIKDLKDYDARQKSKIFSSRAECYIRTKKYKAAISDCDSALKFDSNNIKARFRRAKAYQATSRNREALNDLKFVIKKDSKNSKALDLMRLVQRKLGVGTGGAKDKRLDYDPETDVAWKDQQTICEYNILNKLKIELEDEIHLLSKKMKQYDNALEATELILDEDTCKLQIGTCFMTASDEEIQEYTKARMNEMKLEVRERQSALHDTLDELTKYRRQLKAKFGDHIGLPEIKPSEYTGKF